MIPFLVRLVVFFSSFLPSQLRAEKEREKLSHVFFSTQSKKREILDVPRGIISSYGIVNTICPSKVQEREEYRATVVRYLHSHIAVRTRVLEPHTKTFKIPSLGYGRRCKSTAKTDLLSLNLRQKKRKEKK